jgi:hypothetical protein
MVLGVARRKGPVRLMRRAQHSRSLAQKLCCIQRSLSAAPSKGRPGEPAGFGVPDDLLGSAPPAVPQVQGGEVVAGRVGGERGVAQALDGVEQGQLGAGVGAFAAHDQAGAVWPPVEVDEIGDLGDLGAVAGLSVGFAGGYPVLFLHQQ